MFDALDTLWLLDMKPEFERAVDHISRVQFRKTQVRSGISVPVHHYNY